MTVFTFLWVFSSVALNALAQLFLKMATNQLGKLFNGNMIESLLRIALQPFVILGLLCYAVSFVVWIVVLSKASVSVAYPMQSIGYIIVLLLGCFMLDEPLSVHKVLGVSLLILGIYFISRGQ